jgi:hypothetical protein
MIRCSIKLEEPRTSSSSEGNSAYEGLYEGLQLAVKIERRLFVLWKIRERFFISMVALKNLVTVLSMLSIKAQDVLVSS